MKSKHIIAVSVLLMPLLAAGDAFAQIFIGPSKFSRACRFDQLPTGTKAIASEFLYFMGGPSSLRNLHSQSLNSQALWWINESLTTDYYSVRYYLFAKSNVYVKGNAKYGNPDYFNLVKSYKSGWTVNQIDDQIRNNWLFNPGYVNRGLPPWYNARAGKSDIYDKWILTNTAPDTPATLGLIEVRGRHSYYDAISKREFDLGESKSNNCNLESWGFAIFDR